MAPFNRKDLYAGIVEVCHNGYWGTICTDSLTRSWSEKNAHMACWNVVDPVTQIHLYSGALNSIILSTYVTLLPQMRMMPLNRRMYIMCAAVNESMPQVARFVQGFAECADSL